MNAEERKAYDEAYRRITKWSLIAKLGESEVKIPYLDLSDLALTRLPPEIGRLTQLPTLDLKGNCLTTLPQEIGQLAALEELYLDDNHLSDLPPEIGSLTSLETLKLGNNRLTSLPPEIGQLSTLKKLFLDNNQLSALPPEVGKLKSLESLFLLNNHLTAIPSEIGLLRSLTSLYLGDNQLTNLPQEFGRLMNLQCLSLNNNRLTRLPLEIGKIRTLQELYLHDNPELGIPPEFLGSRFGKMKGSGDPRVILSYYFRHGLNQRVFDIFLSHSSLDKALADAICHTLEAAGVRCWIAPRDIHAGEDWAGAIVRAIPQCKGMVLVFSTHANASEMVMREVTQAAKHRLWILPVRVEDTKPTGGMDFYLADRHWLDAVTPSLEAHLERIRDQVRHLVER